MAASHQKSEKEWDEIHASQKELQVGQKETSERSPHTREKTTRCVAKA